MSVRAEALPVYGSHDRPPETEQAIGTTSLFVLASGISTSSTTTCTPAPTTTTSSTIPEFQNQAIAVAFVVSLILAASLIGFEKTRTARTANK